MTHVKKICEASGLKMCPTCKSVLKGVCGKVNYRNENGQKPCMILAACNLQTLKSLMYILIVIMMMIV